MVVHEEVRHLVPEELTTLSAGPLDPHGVGGGWM